MYRIISYLSTVNPDITPAEITDLLDFVKFFNNSNDISGALLYSDGTFFQILEGEPDIVESIFKKIEMDNRHFGIIKLVDECRDVSAFDLYHSCFSVISEDTNSHKEITCFLEREKMHNPKYYNSFSYLTNKMICTN